MTEPMIIITNNPLVPTAYLIKQNCDDVRYFPMSYREILCLARDEIHSGHKLLTHPLSGSVKPGETPYKSLGISKTTGPLDFDSLSIIEKAIECCDKFPIREKSKDPSLQEDFQVIDLTLIQSVF